MFLELIQKRCLKLHFQYKKEHGKRHCPLWPETATDPVILHCQASGRPPAQFKARKPSRASALKLFYNSQLLALSGCSVTSDLQTHTERHTHTFPAQIHIKKWIWVWVWLHCRTPKQWHFLRQVSYHETLILLLPWQTHIHTHTHTNRKQDKCILLCWSAGLCCM